MSAGREPNWNPVSRMHPSVWTEVVGLSSKDRMSIPLMARRRLEWLSVGTTELLAILEADGSAEVVSWKGGGADRIAQIEAVLRGLTEPDRSEVALAAMDRYIRLRLDGTGRMVLPTTLLSHLEAIDPPALRLVVRNGRLWFWSERRWRAGQLERYLQMAKAVEDRSRNSGAR
jgi:DNA-binding transcriptional regulator/RsmH inhibitor MraZ